MAGVSAQARTEYLLNTSLERYLSTNLFGVVLSMETLGQLHTHSHETKPKRTVHYSIGQYTTLHYTTLHYSTLQYTKL
jgi:hypothetical protein